MKTGILKAGLIGMTALVGVKAADTMGFSVSDARMSTSRVFALAMAIEGEASPSQGEHDAPVESIDVEVVEKGPESLLPEVLIDIARERDALRDRESLIEAQQAELELAKQALAEQSRQLTALRSEIEGLLKTGEGNHVGDVTKLVKMYAGMKPDRASSILDSGDIAVSVQVIAAMKESDAGPILAGMSPVRAQAISKIIFERSRLPADQDLIGIDLN